MEPVTIGLLLRAPPRCCSVGGLSADPVGLARRLGRRGGSRQEPWPLPRRAQASYSWPAGYGRGVCEQGLTVGRPPRYAPVGGHDGEVRLASGWQEPVRVAPQASAKQAPDRWRRRVTSLFFRTSVVGTCDGALGPAFCPGSEECARLRASPGLAGHATGGLMARESGLLRPEKAPCQVSI